jgi:WD40 repeat protein
MKTVVQQSLPPATPRYILRGHASPIQALHFCARNARLVSADADGWVVVWDMTTKRPRAVWRAHEGAVLEVKGFEINDGGFEIFT